MINTTIKNYNLKILKAINPENINLSASLRQEYEPILWRSIVSEYDSINFYNKIISLNLNYTPEFKDFFPGWLNDEANHTAGFKELYQLVYNIETSAIDERLQSRTSNFDVISEFLIDEFTICLLLAFDEIVTAHVYERSIPFYRTIEPIVLPKWIKLVKRDEAKHFINIIKVIQKAHKTSLNKADKILKRIIEVDTCLSDYNGTFVLDHACPEFPLTKQELINICAKTVINKITRKG